MIIYYLQYVFCKKCLQGFHIGDCLPREEQFIVDISGYSVDPKLASQVYNIDDH